MIRIHRPDMPRLRLPHRRRGRRHFPVGARDGGRGAVHRSRNLVSTAGSSTVAGNPCAARDTAARRAPGVAASGSGRSVSGMAGARVLVVIPVRCAGAPRTPAAANGNSSARTGILETRWDGFAAPAERRRWRKTTRACRTVGAKFHHRATGGYGFAPPSGGRPNLARYFSCSA